VGVFLGNSCVDRSLDFFWYHRRHHSEPARAPSFLTVLLAITVRAQSKDSVCWREENPGIPGDWSSYGFVVEDTNRFQFIEGAKVQLLWNDGTLLQANLIIVREVTSNARGFFDLGRIPTGNFRIRVSMPGRQQAVARGMAARMPLTAWPGRGLRVALAPVGPGCSRIWRAGEDDADCGDISCGRLPRGTIRITYKDGSTVSHARFYGYRSLSKSRWKLDGFFKTDNEGIAHTDKLNGCYSFRAKPRRPGAYAHLCFSETTSNKTAERCASSPAQSIRTATP
jgi:hypothetical protein